MYIHPNLLTTSFKFELIFRTALFVKPVSVFTPSLASIGASVEDLVIPRLKLPYQSEVVLGSPASSTPSLSRSCHTVALAIV